MKRRFFISVLSLILCITLLIGAVPISTAAGNGARAYIRLAELSDITEAYLSDSEELAAAYPNGAISLVETSAQFEMDQTYAVDIVRQGGTAGEAKIKLSTVDMTAGYGEDYRLYLTDHLSDEGVAGSKKLYYYNSGVAYIARRERQETVYMNEDGSEDPAQAQQEASEINDTAAENMPHSSETVLTFAEGERIKTVFIETMKNGDVTDDLEFMLTLSEPKNCSVSANTSGMFTIRENRPKPKSTLDIVSTSVNPESDEAMVSVRRTGNLGGYDTFRVTTKSDAAAADRDYVAVAENLRFAPGVSEIKVPVTLLDGAEDGSSFNVEISDAGGNAEIGDASASVRLDSREELSSTGEGPRKYVTSFTFKTGDDAVNNRKYEFVDLLKFNKSTAISCWGNDDGKAYTDGSKYVVGYAEGGLSKAYAASLCSPEAIDFSGVKDVHMCYDHLTGSTVGDDAIVVIAGSNPLDDGNGDCSWMKSKANCAHWGMGNISSSHITNSLSLTDRSEQYIFLIARKCAFWGSCWARFHSYSGDTSCSFRLNLQDYNVRIIDPEPVKLFKNGKLDTVYAIKDAQFTDPGKTSSSWTTEATFYRYDTTTIKANVDSKYGSATLKGVYICDPDNTSKHSSLITLSGGNFTFSPEIIRGYSNYISNNKLVIQPVYEFDKCNFSVNSYEDKDKGVKFTADNNNHSGVFTVAGREYGTVTWSYDDSRGDYYDGDELLFTFRPNQSSEDMTVAYDIRSADNQSDLNTCDWTHTGSASDSKTITLTNRWFSVRPYLTDLTVKNRLIVNSPDGGDFTSKGTKYATSNPDGTVTVTGYYIKGDENHATVDESFVNYAPGRRMEYTAKPKDGYFAEWTYTDAVTHEKKTYRGNTFYYTVQTPFLLDDNTVTLNFCSTSLVIYRQAYAPLSGNICIPKGTILHPATSSTEVMLPAANASIYMDGFVGVTDENGSFTLKTDAESNTSASVPVVGENTNILPGTYIGYRVYKVNETHRALVYYNGNTYICDVKLTADSVSDLTSFNTKITLDSATIGGVLPKRTEAYSVDSGTYGDSITLVTDRSVNFSVDFDARNISADKPMNLARWSFESEDGILRSMLDVPIDSGSSVARYSCVIKEKAKPGDHMFIEFYNKGYDSSASEKMTFYGRYEVGYQFVAANIEEVVSYMPDIGYYDEDELTETGADLASTGEKYAKTPTAPALGPVSPLFSIFGFLPTYSDAATGQKDQKTGKDLYILEIGVQFSVAKKDTADENGKWSASSIAKQWDKLAKIIDKSPGELVQNMKTSTQITLTVTFAYQLEYYTADSGSRCYTESLFLLGGKIGVKISIPFTVVAIPCFVYFDISADNVGYLVHTPNDKTDGYWTSKMLNNSNYFETHGEFSQDFKIQFGVGVGWDGLASIGGHVDFGLHSKIKGTSHGKMTCDVSGGVFAQLLFFKVDKTWKIHEWTLLDTDENLASTAANLLNSEGGDLFADTRLGDLKLARAEDVYDDSFNEGRDIASTASDPAALYTHETYVEENTAQMKPVIGRISDTKYLIATVMDTEEQTFALRYYIYNTETNQIDEKGSPVTEVIAANGMNLDDPSVLALVDCEDLVGDVNIIDCGDKLLLIWEGCTVGDYQEAAVDDALRSFKIAAVVYDKKADKFTDFDIVESKANSLPDQLKGVYNPSTGTAHIFYESIDVTDVDVNTTMKQVNDLPISLNTCSIKLSDAHPSFSDSSVLNINGTTLSNYDVSLYKDSILVSLISAGKNGLIVEKPLTAEGSEYDASKYGTKNKMYLDQYTDANGSLTRKSDILIADEDHVTANPEFVKLNYQGVENTLLFYKCNGRYGYQNIENLYVKYEHHGKNGSLDSDCMNPAYITNDYNDTVGEDHTVGEDFKVYASDDGALYALWTQSEGTQQQIWGRQFQVDSIEDNDKVTVTGEDGNVMYKSDGMPMTADLEEPVHILHGYWGNKSRLTTDGVKDDEAAAGTGYYKGKFDATIPNGNQLICAYNSFDYDFGEAEEGDKIRTINNRFIISEFDVTSSYYPDNDFSDPDEVAVSNPHPTPGETVKIKVHAENNSFSNGRNVTLNLLITGAGEEIGSITYPVWIAGESKDAEFEYTVPENADLSQQTISFGFEIYEGGNRKYRSMETATLSASPRLSIEIAHAQPIKYITDDDKTTAYHITAAVTNTGNIPYAGGDELTFIYNDQAAQADVMNQDVPDTKPFYVNFGGVEIPEIAVGSTAHLTFISEDIPESIFDEYGTNSAKLKLAVTPKDGIGWKTVKGNEPYNFLDELGIGQFVKPVAEEITAVSAQAVTVPLGSTCFINPSTTPAAAAVDAAFTYKTDSDLITVDENGLVKGVSRGTATVTVSCGDVSTQVEVTVGAPEVGDVDLDGDITIIDATLIQRFLVDLENLSDEALAQADADRDGDVSILDATAIQRYLADLLFSL